MRSRLDPDEIYLSEVEGLRYDLSRAALFLPDDYSPEPGEEYVEGMRLQVPFLANTNKDPVIIAKINQITREVDSIEPKSELDRGPFGHLEWLPDLSSDSDVEIDTVNLDWALGHVGKKYEIKVVLRPEKKQ